MLLLVVGVAFFSIKVMCEVRRFTDGSTYSGGWAEGQKEGEGTERTVAGIEYVGGFRGGDYSGKGVLRQIAADKTVAWSMEGQFKCGKLHGEGVKVGEMHCVCTEFIAS